MSNLLDRGYQLYRTLRWGKGYTPAVVALERSHVDKAEALGADFKAGDHYFQVRINEMYLAYQREWFSTYDPVVFAATQFHYDRDIHYIPRLIGPALLNQHTAEIELPEAMRYIDTPVAGWHPYIGDEMMLFFVLYRASQGNHLRNLLNLTENILGVFDPSTALKNYATMAHVILDCLDMIFDARATTPVVGLYQTFTDRGLGDRFSPGYYALIDAAENTVDPTHLWVRGNRLCVGRSADTAQPYGKHDFVLMSIVQSQERMVNQLPFYTLWQETQDRALEFNDVAWDAAKAQFKVLWQQILRSPDLTNPQKTKLVTDYKKQIGELREQAKGLSELGPTRSGAALPAMDAEFLHLSKMLDDLT